MKITKISKDTLIPTIWDGGETFEYYIYPENALYANRDFLFRISAATINKVPSTFTKFNNYQRFLVMLDNDLNIKINGKEEYYTPKDTFKFDSNSDITSYTKGNDFNLMVSKNFKESDVFFLKDAVQLKQSFVFLFALNETSVEVNNEIINLKKKDLLLIENKDQSDILLKTENSILVGNLII
ncbi:HutD family protein [Paenimyroides baculatum]|uniref:HutD-family protein n=1 Tax=Paenimyroides baculatum TaxID=2608000 RepID=A0A5M6CVL4_9FLAO|nr:HutD family protein [Paenimyroides baculatum]KAA5538420.1 HutD-family protein [Paenimyroides baculatum]